MNRLILAGAAGIALMIAAPALAQGADGAGGRAWYQPTDVYGSLGYTGINQGSPSGAHVGAVTGRLGARFGRYVGLEAEASGGVKNDTPTPGGYTVSLDHQYAGYVVGYLPVLPNADLFARAGYGNSKIRYQGTGGFAQNTESFNYGAGAQYFLNAHDGVRAEYTRQESNDSGPNADTIGVSYVHRF